MLHELHVEDLGILESVTVVFGGGLTAITGETGAGKTLLVEAINLLVGSRADATLVRDGATEARVDGRFVDPSSGAEIVITRVVPLEGRSRAYVNGKPATALELATLGSGLVDLHGQHAHQSLLAPTAQRRALDRFVGAPAHMALARVAEQRERSNQLDREIRSIGGDERARSREIDMLAFQIAEIEAVGIAAENEEASLEAEEAMLADADAHREALLSAYRAVEDVALDAVGAAATALAGRNIVADLEARARSMQAELAELGHELRVAAEGVADDPDRLAVVQVRRRQLRELCRKYGETTRDVVAYAAEARSRQAELRGHAKKAADLERSRERALDAMYGAAEELSILRRTCADALGEEIATHLRSLAMPSARFGVDVTPAQLGIEGADDVTFMLSANAGEPLRPLARAASGGELARGMLAVRLVLSEAPPTLIFDEVDAGMGGEAGVAIGRQLARLGARHQVLVVTHLAQVAAFADVQIDVAKQERHGRTVAEADLVVGEARVGALSRMLAGFEVSEHARAHAEELLANAILIREHEHSR